MVITGCQNTGKQDLLTGEIETLTQEKTQLQEKLTQTDNQNEQLKKQVQILSGLPEGVRLKSLYHLQQVKIHRYTNLLDEDKDGKMDTLAVYVQPIDEQGDVIKAAGAVDVGLWDLSKPGDQALLGRWSVGPEELKKHWVSFLVTDYRLTFTLTRKIEHYDRPLTVKIVFTDYLSGKVFNEQKTIEPIKP